MADTDLHTPRLLLRDIAPGDVDAVHAYAGDPEVCRFMVWGPNTLDDTRAFVAEQLVAAAAPDRRTHNRLIVHAGSGQVIGGIELRLESPANQRGDFGYILRRDHWGQGYATEASRAVLDLGFGQLGLHRITATCDPGNTASARVLEKSGLRREGLMRQHLRRGGQWRDSLLYAVLASDERP
ncbi:GNAT family N-acetyltransferase [Kineosporia sp. J2-2]|uniref:GNAT family N-acetyltransferase n=1 Tax=Kineosporia corallincola TaxID=2835133 RepID=A0ABS5TN58_9ACTN|nr:GNAT family protein [Kineosporia corallincola]MBT0772527.1 GNAT family N-acetyltransferase [Kineosporia corallincola]